MSRARSIFTTAAAALVAASIAAFAANTTFFTSIGDIVFPISPPTNAGATPGAIDNMTIGATTPRPGTFTTVDAAVVRAALGSYAKNPASVASYRSYLFSNSMTQMLFTPSGTVAYAYITLAAAPIDGQQVCLFTTQQITAIYLLANTGQTIANAITGTLAANAHACYLYSIANTTWDRSE